MSSSEKFSLKWNDFQQNITNTYSGLRSDIDFSDVTLVSEENQQIEAHRVILAACSPFFTTVLKRNKHSPKHPIIFLRGVKPTELKAIVDFIYHGETNIYQEDLNSFLALAEELQLKGLATGDERNVEYTEKKTTINDQRMTLPTSTKKTAVFTSQNTKTSPEPGEVAMKSNSKIEQILDTIKVSDIMGWDNQELEPYDSEKIALDNKDELELVIDSMIEGILEEDKRWKCTRCGHKHKHRSIMKRHVETHLSGVSHPCTICGHVCRTSKGLIDHVGKHHRNEKSATKSYNAWI